jgi:hypothetical protein
MKNRTRAGIALTVGAALALGPSLAASAASSAIANGSFEADAVGSTTITGWTSLNQAIDLGVTSIAGCVTVDTSDYSNLRDYADDASSIWDVEHEAVPGQPEGFFYVHDWVSKSAITVLGDRLVYNTVEDVYYLETTSAPVTAPAFDLSSVTEPTETEPAPSDPAPSEPAPTEPAPTEPAPTEPAPAPEENEPTEPAPVDPAPEQPEPAEQTPLTPTTGGFTYLARDSWSTDQEDAFQAARDIAVDPTIRQDNLSLVTLDEEEYEVTVVDQAFLTQRAIDEDEDPIELGRDGRVLELFSDLSSDEDSLGSEGYIVHGPAVVSAPFAVGAGRQITLDWKAVDESDDFHVFGYLLNVDTCAQTEVIDATGELADWTSTSVAIPAAGTYRFVFVSGSYDKSWGGAAGAYMYIDNIVQTPVFSSPGIDLALAAGLGDYLPGSDVQVSGGGLQPNSEYDLTLRSTPVVVTEGLTDGDGSFLDIVPLPLDITPGQHTITLRGQGPSGPLTQVAYITVGADGTLQYVSFDGPQAALAETGAAESAGLLALALLLVVTGAAAFELERRRRSPFSTVYVR